MTFPPRVILALVFIGPVALIALWGAVVVLRSMRLTGAQRMAGIGGIMLTAVLLIAWAIFVWPAYWD